MMIDYIKKLIPSKLKLGKTKRRITRFSFWMVGLCVGIYHVTLALTAALQTKITTGQLSVVKKLKICVTNATTDVATVLGDAGFTVKIAGSAFFQHLCDNPILTIILFFTIYETVKNFNKAIKFVRRCIKNISRKV